MVYLKLWGGDGRRVKKNKVRQPVRHSVDPVQDDFTIDWDAVWAKEEAERKAAEQKNRIKGKKRKKRRKIFPKEQKGDKRWIVWNRRKRSKALRKARKRD